jgi:hypothetical protein
LHPGKTEYAGIVHRLSAFQAEEVGSIPIARSTKNRLDPSGFGRFSYVLVALLFFVHSNRRSLPCFFARSLDILAIMEYTKNS